MNALCARCSGRIEQHDPTGDGLASFWSHEHHPEDGHDAEPVAPNNVLLIGGPRSGWCYSVKDWEARREAIRHAVAHRQDVVDDISGYRASGEIEAPPTRPTAWCAVWRWT